MKKDVGGLKVREQRYPRQCPKVHLGRTIEELVQVEELCMYILLLAEQLSDGLLVDLFHEASSMATLLLSHMHKVAVAGSIYNCNCPFLGFGLVLWLTVAICLMHAHNTQVSLDVEHAVAVEQEDLPADLFSVLFKCNTHSSPWRALLAHAIALQRPLLAILAGCHEVHRFTVDP